MHLRIRHRRLGDHHHARVFVGADVDRLALAGTLTLRAAPVDELEPILVALEDGAAGLDVDEIDEDQLNPDVEPDEPTSARPFAIRRNEIGRYRGLVGLKQRDLAERIGIAQPDLSMIEAGYAVPRDDVLERIASQLSTPADLLYPDDR